MRARAVAFILKGYPRLSETFIAQEVRGLERSGLAIQIISLRHPTDAEVHPVHKEINAPVLYLPEYLYQEPLRVLRGWWAARKLPGYRDALRIWRRDLRRDTSANRMRRLGQAFVLARELPPNVSHLHAHFLHTPASVARYTSLLTGMEWSCSAHAKDIWTSPDWEKREKLSACLWTVTCTSVNRDHLRSLAADPSHVELLYHGLDLRRFPMPPARRPPRDGNDARDPVVLLSVGRAVQKKGYDDLLDALGVLPAALSWRFVHIGGGPLLASLKKRATRLGIASRLEWLGPRAQQEVVRQYAAADLFVLASRVAEDGDRDGLPNVLMEAQCQGLACVATRVSAIPELIEDGVNGLLVPERDSAALSRKLADLIRDPARRERLGKAGNTRTRSEFSFESGIRRLVAKFDSVGQSG